MASGKTEHVPQPTDPSVDEMVGIDGEAAGDADAEGHSMPTLELARTIATERVRDGDKVSRDRVRVREARSSDGDLVSRNLGSCACSAGG